jgi:hypothetical protein
MKGYKMKKVLFLIAATAMMSSASYASKARLSALANSASITDTQSIFTNIADLNYVAEFATFEMGETPLTSTTAADATPNAEGGFLQSSGDAKWGFYLGRENTATNSGRSTAGTAVAAAFLEQENPIDVYYGSKAGDMAWGVDFSLSNSKKDGLLTATTDDQKQSTMGLSLGVKTDVWGAYANVGLGSTAQTGDVKYNGKQGLTLGGHYYVNQMKYYVKQDMFGFDAKDATAATVLDYSTATTTLGMTNTWKQDASRVFYGVAYTSTATKSKTTAETKTDIVALPVHIGMEVDAASWLVLRGSIVQNVLLGTTKTTTTTSVTDTTSHNTKTAAGAGLKFGKSNVDFAMNMGSSGDLKFDTLGASAAYTYLF